MKIIPVSFDSLGTRSMATLVKTNKTSIFIDPAAALGPTRYGLPPNLCELKALEKARKDILKLSKETRILIITHYHYDHHFPPEDELFEEIHKDKIILTKNTEEKINLSGKSRGKKFCKNAEKVCKKLEFADGKEFNFGDIKINFSPAVWHGKVKSIVGTVTMACIQEGNQKLIHASDAQDLTDDEARDWVIKQNPDILILDGAITYMLGYRLSYADFKHGQENVIKVIENCRNLKEIIYEHHLVRDINYRNRITQVLEKANKNNIKISTAAEFLGKDNLFLEACRKEIKQGKRVI